MKTNTTKPTKQNPLRVDLQPTPHYLALDAAAVAALPRAELQDVIYLRGLYVGADGRLVPLDWEPRKCSGDVEQRAIDEEDRRWARAHKRRAV